MANQPVRRGDYRHFHKDGTITEVERRIRGNGDRSDLVRYKSPDDHSLVVWHVVHDREGRVLHLHEKRRQPGADVTWPPEGYVI